MSVNVHNPDQYMASLRTIIAQGRKKIGLLIGAGAPAGMRKIDGTYPLVPAVAGLTNQVLATLAPKYGAQIAGLKAELPKDDIETILSRVRSLAKVIGKSKVHDLDGPGFEKFGEEICAEIGKIVDARLPKPESAYSDLVNWITGTSRDSAVEIFTTNYDLLLEEAFEVVGAPYFDGFTGGREPFFDPVSVARNDLPARWTRLWKLHGSLGWCAGEKGEVIRTGKSSASHLVFPEHLKYDQTQKAPYTALLDRLKTFLGTDDTLLISIGFSYADAHVAARIDEGLAGNTSASVFAFMFKALDEEVAACDLASKRPNFSVYARDKAMMNGTPGAWVVPAELPSKDWGPIRSTYWGKPQSADPDQFLLGAVEPFCKFFAASRSAQIFSPIPAPTASVPTLVVPV
ncbi:SIR2 family protein [Mesorhizobium sp. WSM1497]|uniref:SIR2 family protein n=1 Tax=Mesorhizobium sp. WSM1497 TaxID=278153 RepID=UPI0007ED4F41|nr:SIR2 family protein [Mesorhizobium sp. WSM1497]ARP63406.1 SIR2 family protein [Mesorhizobium sp. WSM1497]